MSELSTQERTAIENQRSLMRFIAALEATRDIGQDALSSDYVRDVALEADMLNYLKSAQYEVSKLQKKMVEDLIAFLKQKLAAEAL